jgi:hypothetical protein
MAAAYSYGKKKIHIFFFWCFCVFTPWRGMPYAVSRAGLPNMMEEKIDDALVQVRLCAVAPWVWGVADACLAGGRASSVLNRDAGQFGAQHLFDGCEETCWNSAQGSPQWLLLRFAAAAPRPRAVTLAFQGGFAGRECEFLGACGGAGLARAW